MSKADPKQMLARELYRESYEWLTDNHPAIAEAVETLTLDGTTPEEIKRFVLDRLGPERNGLATRCLNASRFLLAQAR